MKAPGRGAAVATRAAALPEATHLRHCWPDGGTSVLRSLGDLPVGSFELPVGRTRR